MINKRLSTSTKPNIDTIGYNGQVKITVKKENKIVLIKNYHNAGGLPLFDYLARCIKGELDESKRPNFVKLFTRNDDLPPTNVTITDISDPVCPAMACNAISSVEAYKEGDTEIGKSLCMHFTIPCSAFSRSGNLIIKQVGLYCQKYNLDEDKKNYSAYFNFTNIAGDEWEPVEISTSSGDYNIFIEWTLAIR